MSNLNIDFSIPCVMGILNVTPDSFSDGGQFQQLDSAVNHALQMQNEGAAIIDVGGESARPNAEPVSLAEELHRVIPIIEVLKKALELPISIDTSKPEVMTAAVKAGASFINDIRALQEPRALETVASLNVPVCLMHMLADPKTMQQNPSYDDVIETVGDFLEARINAAIDAGINKKNIIIDPGFGFGKTVTHNLQIIKQLQKLKQRFKLPILVGVSRKSTIGRILGDVPTDERLFGSIAMTAIAVNNGAQIIRAHDVKATVDALAVAGAILCEKIKITKPECEARP